ncbi:MAG: class I SAM-dependent methyltransferase [Candidatus Coatesbacteria bacterium]|nr:class I SAM-dependent methyltransferase [Candidatus Coatesbacteria bacterium]
MDHKEYRKLHAEWYELVSVGIDHSAEIDFWARSIEEAGEPALELGSGTGRVLVPLLERGFHIVGIDTSADMTARCLAACEAKGLKAELHEQSMLEFDLAREFGLIFLDSGGLGLFASDQEIKAVFERVMAHLRPGGLFIYEFEPVPDERKDDSKWTGGWVRGPGDVVVAWRSQMKYDSATHVWECLFIVEKFIGGRLIETEANERTGRFFTTEEAVQYAKSAGFEKIRATNWLTEKPPGKESKAITVRCKKPVEKID